ncbi:hypothetical protein [Burkholderia vietnamiensis]|uniref:hypothetical protein n=1 Tax=Burkholderia vietnamiensis TaxID=60552 RepID=UPI0015933FAC|nr:hypothetical protein [Burkholderia vietnamiensis]
MSEQNPIDWERIEAEYRAGVLSLREIAALHDGVNHVAIARRAKKEGWTRDLAAKIKAKAEDLVTRQAVTPEVTAQRAVTEREVVEANAARIAQVRGEHRSDIARARGLTIRLLAELEGQTDNFELFEQLGELLRDPDDKGLDKLNDLYQKVISLPGRVDGMKKLSETLKNLIGLERDAYGIGEAALTDPGAGGAAPGYIVTPAVAASMEEWTRKAQSQSTKPAG